MSEIPTVPSKLEGLLTLPPGAELKEFLPTIWHDEASDQLCALQENHSFTSEWIPGTLFTLLRSNETGQVIGVCIDQYSHWRTDIRV